MGCLDSTRENYAPDAELHDSTMCGPVDLEKVLPPVRDAVPQLIMNMHGTRHIPVPAWTTGVELSDARGRIVWTYRSARIHHAGSIRIPDHVKTGLLHVQFLYD